MPRPSKSGDDVVVDGVGKIFVAFADYTSARKFQIEANGRKFQGRVVAASFYPLDAFEKGQYTLLS